MSDSLWPHGLCCPWNSSGRNTGVGSFSLLHGIFPTQGLSPGFPHCRRILYQLSHQGSPRILEWVAYPFSSGSFQPRNWTRVSCIAGRFFTNWAFREAPNYTPIKKIFLSWTFLKAKRSKTKARFYSTGSKHPNPPITWLQPDSLLLFHRWMMSISCL